MKRKYALFILSIIQLVIQLVIISGGLFAAEDYQELYGRQIEAIEVSGNTRTNDNAVLRIGGVGTSTEFTRDTQSRIENNLTKSGLFASAIVQAEPLVNGSVKIRIEVKEKWTLLPLPVFFTDGESVMGGLVVIESNLAGTAKQLISGVMGGTDGLSGFAVYVDPAVLQSSWRLTLSGGAGTEKQEVDTPDGSLAYVIKGEALSGSFGLGYKFTDALEIGGRIRFQQYLVDSVEGGISLPDGTYTEQQIGLQARFDKTIPYGSLLSGTLSSLEGSYLFKSGEFTQKGMLSLYIPTIASQRLRLLVAGGRGEKPFYLEETVSGRDGFRTLPFGKAVADEYISVSGGYDLPVLEKNWGALVLTGFYELGWYSSTFAGSHDFQGPGGGFRVYLRKVAVPALGLDLAYNLNSRALVFSVAVGMRM